MSRQPVPQDASCISANSLARHEAERGTSAPLWHICICATLIAAVFLAFGPALDNEFINWDDPPNFTDNPFVRGFSAQNLRWMWTQTHLGHYQPLTWMTVALDYHLWGEIGPRGLHLTSMVFHALNAVLFYCLSLALLRRYGGLGPPARRAAATLAAILFALHPMRVESVVWATERRDVVSGCFFLLCLLAYLRACPRGRSPSRAWWIASIGLHVCAVLSKVICVTILPVLLVLDVCPLRRLRGTSRWWGGPHTRVWIEKIPFLVVSLAASFVAFAGQGPAMVGLTELGLAHRIANSFYALAFYPLKLLAPINLIPIYELPHNVSPFAAFYWLSAAFVALVTGFLLLARRRFPALLAAWVAWLALLSPVLSLTQNGAQFAADRYTYLSCLGPALLLAAALVAVCFRLGARRARAAAIMALSVAIALPLAILTHRQSKRWHDSVTLWEYTLDTLRDKPDSWVANRNLADALMDLDEVPRALEHYRRALDIEQRNASLCSNAAIAFVKLGLFGEADHYARKAIEISGVGLTSVLNAGYVKLQMKDWNGAIEIYSLGIEHHPGVRRLHANLGLALARKQNHPAALVAFQEAIEIDPTDPALFRQAARSLLELNRFAEAERMLQRALHLKPDLKPALRLRDEIQRRAQRHRTETRILELEQTLLENPHDLKMRLAIARDYASAGRLDDAVSQYERVLDGQPHNHAARIELSVCLQSLGREPHAAAILRAGLDLSPDSPELALALSRMLSESPRSDLRDPDEALRLAKRAVQTLTDPGPRALGTLANAYAQMGDLDRARDTCRAAIKKAQTLGRQKVAESLRQRLELYRAGKSFHRPPATNSQPADGIE